MLIWLVACAEPADKVEVDADTGESADEHAWVPPTFDCALDDPLVLDAAALPSESFLYGPSDVFLVASWYDLEGASSYAGCPEVEVDGDQVTFTGDCDGGDWGFSGTWVAGNPDTVGLGDMVLDGVHAWAPGEWTNFRVLDADGTIDETVGVSDYRLETVLELHVEGMFGAPLDGDCALSGGLRRHWSIERSYFGVDETGWGEGHYSVAAADGTTGDYCLVFEEGDGCKEEPSGGWAVQGDKLLVVTYDPEVSCDGCGNATLDGVPIGLVCR